MIGQAVELAQGFAIALLRCPWVSRACFHSGHLPQQAGMLQTREEKGLPRNQIVLDGKRPGEIIPSQAPAMKTYGGKGGCAIHGGHGEVAQVGLQDIGWERKTQLEI